MSTSYGETFETKLNIFAIKLNDFQIKASIFKIKLGSLQKVQGELSMVKMKYDFLWKFVVRLPQKVNTDFEIL